MRAYERLLEYVKFPTASDPESKTCPSTEGQRIFAEYLVKEMLALGVADAELDENGYVTGTIQSNLTADTPTLGFIAHMDVSPDAPSVDIKTRI
ncbi:MAG: peptidase T, partial [Oscillospiraceae bacterium]|nr:peptidase T [Oscillospiraceae bacterium]